MKKVILIALTLLIVSLLSAQRMPDRGMNMGDCPGRGGKHQQMGKMRDGNNADLMMRVMHHLELTAKQQAKLQELRVAQQKSAIEHNAQIETHEIDLRLAKQNMDFDQMKKINNAIYDLKKEHRSKQIDNQKECWDQLTKEQKAEVQELLKNPAGMRRDCDEEKQV